MATITKKRRTRRDIPQETPADKLARIQSMPFRSNDALAIIEFTERGIPAHEIIPRVNVLTYAAWKALGRQVAKGAISVKATVWVDKDKDDKTKGTYPVTSTLFHRYQTIEADAPKGTLAEGYDNPRLFKREE